MSTTRSGQLLASIPREFGTQLRPHTRAITADIIHAIQRGVPAYARPLRGTFGKMVVTGVEEAVRHCVNRIGNPEGTDDNWIDLYRARGRVEYVSGRNTDSLQSAVRIAGRVAWRHASAVLRSCGYPNADISLAAEAVFAYIDDLSATAVQGYHEAMAEVTGATDRQRRQLLDLLLSPEPAAGEAINALADTAGWTPPAEIAVVALEHAEDAKPFPVELVDDSALIDFERPQPCLLTPAPRRQLAAISGIWSGWVAAVSPMSALTEAPAALRLATRALRHAPRDGQSVIWCDEHLAALWLGSEDFLASELARQRLDPLTSLGDTQRERLSATLLAWLESRGGAPEVARKLRLHPQTVRTHLHQLEQLFGERLTDPDERLELQLALRAQRIASN